jgi:hypothetical protein
MKTIKQSTCPGLSGTNTISYEVGLKQDQSRWLRLTKSSGGGFLTNDWISMAAITKTLKQSPPPFTSYVLHKLFAGKSINSRSFLMAVLKQEGFVKPDEKKQQAFVIDDLDAGSGKLKNPLAKDASSAAKKKRHPTNPSRDPWDL